MMDFEKKISIKTILYLFIMLYPVLPQNYYICGLSYTNICSLLICVLFFVGMKKYKISNIFKYDRFFWLYLLVYALFAFVTAGLMTGIAWMVMTIMVTFTIIYLISSERIFYIMIDLIVFASALMSVIGIAETATNMYFFQSDLLEGWSDSFRYGIMRCSGTFGHPINFSIFQAIAALLMFYRMNMRVSIRRRKFYLVCYGLAVVSILCSFSRLPILFFIVVQGLLILALGPGKALKYIIGIVLLAVCGVTVLELAGIEVIRFFGDFVITLMSMLGIDVGSSETAISFGNRFDLYAWVIDAVGKDYFLGKGVDAQFQYQLNPWFVKTSIEVHYLYIYFKCGLVGLASLVASYLGSAVFFAKRRKNRLKSEGKLSFLTVLIIILLGYYVVLFGVQETDTIRIYCELIAMGIAYVRLCKKGKGIGV